MTNWNEIKIRCSSLGKLMTEPQSKKDKEAGELSKSAKKHLIEVYADLKYGRYYDKSSKYTKKGNNVEEDSITAISVHFSKMLIKNTERVENDFFSGEYDAYLGRNPKDADYVFDAKSPYDLITFLNRVEDGLDDDYYGQLQGYLDLSKAKRGFVCYVLQDTPESQYNDELFRLVKNSGAATEESPEIKEDVLQLFVNHHFADIPKEQKILVFPVDRDDEYIEKAKQKVLKAREYLQQIEEKHINFNKNIKL